MSKLFYRDSGRVVHLQHEELSSSRRARKEFHLPETISSGGTLYILAKSRRDCPVPLQVSVNGCGFTFEPCAPHHYYLTWFALELRPEHLRPGVNIVELWSDSAAMDSWMLGVEGRPDNPGSSLSFDGGKTWQNERMSIRHNLRGEYVVRLRLADPALSDPAPPAIVWESPDCPRLKDMRAVIPAEIQATGQPWEQALALSAWVSGQWTFPSDDEPGQVKEYCPWDALTILAWRKSNFGQYQSNPIAFCVHYAVVFISAATALGLRARGVCGSPSILDRKSGHFVAELWIDEWQKWCHLDPMSDLVFVREGVPLSVAEMSLNRGDQLRELAQAGQGLARSDPPRSEKLLSTFGTGEAFRQWAVWPRNDFLSRPELTPPAHGACSYSETDWLWARQENAGDLGMFPHQLSAEELGLPPPATS